MIVVAHTRDKMLLEATYSEWQNLQWFGGVKYDDQKRDIGTSIDLTSVRDALDLVREMRGMVSQIDQMLVRFRKIAEFAQKTVACDEVKRQTAKK